jgi:IS5 family transposase
MQKQMTFSDVEYGARKRVSRREIFLDMMDGIVPWQVLTALIEPWYFSGARGRPPMGREAMLRMYFLSIWYGLGNKLITNLFYRFFLVSRAYRVS